jgi:hypothetical protein
MPRAANGPWNSREIHTLGGKTFPSRQTSAHILEGDDNVSVKAFTA